MSFIGLIFLIVFISIVASAADSQKKAKMQEAKKQAARRYYQDMSSDSSTAARKEGHKAGKPHSFERAYAAREDDRINAAEQQQESEVPAQKQTQPSHAMNVLSNLPSAIIASEILSKPRALKRLRY